MVCNGIQTDKSPGALLEVYTCYNFVKSPNDDDLMRLFVSADLYVLFVRVDLYVLSELLNRVNHFCIGYLYCIN